MMFSREADAERGSTLKKRSSLKGGRDKEKEERALEELEEAKRENEKLLAKLTDTVNSKTVLTYIIVIGAVVFFIYFFFFGWYWYHNPRDIDDHFTLNGGRIEDEDLFDTDADSETLARYNRRKKLQFEFPSDRLMNPAAGFCINTIDFACGNYTEPRNYLFSGLKESLMHRTNAQIEENLLIGRNKNLRMFVDRCAQSLFGNNDVDLEYLLLALDGVAKSDQPMELLESFGINPLIVFSYQDSFVDWSISHWMRYDATIMYSACSFLKEHAGRLAPFVIPEDCETAMQAFYAELDNIGSGDVAPVLLSQGDVEKNFGPLLPSYISTMDTYHRVWSELQVRHLMSMMEHPSFKLWMLILTTIDAMQYVPSMSLWMAPNNSSSNYYAITYKYLDRHVFSSANNYHLFRHGTGMLGVSLAHAIPYERAHDEAIHSCALLAAEMLPHDVELLRDHIVSETAVQKRFLLLKERMVKTIRVSKFLPEEVKQWIINWIGHFKLQLGFPGDSIALAPHYNSFLEMAWSVRKAHIRNNFHLSWSPKFHASTCNADVLVNEQQVTLPFCLFGVRPLRVPLDFTMAHEMWHLLFPAVMREKGAAIDIMNGLENSLSCFDISVQQMRKDEQTGAFLERFADIMGARLAYQLCIDEGRCSSSDQIQSFLIELIQMFCNGNQVQSRTDIHGTDRSRISYIMKHLMDADGISPLNKNRKCNRPNSSCYVF